MTDATRTALAEPAVRPAAGALSRALPRAVSSSLARLAKALVVPLLALLALEWYARSIGFSDSIAPPSQAALELFGAVRDGTIIKATGFTLAAAGLGLLVGGGLGLLVGLALGLSRRAADAAFLSMEVFRPIPGVALLPLAMLVFGFGVRMEASIVAFVTFWPFAILTQAAVQQVEPRLLEVSTVLGLSRPARLWKIVLPAIVPRLFVALRLGVVLALVVAVTVEIAANPHGLGFGLFMAQQSLRPALMLGWLFWIACVGYTLNASALALQSAVARRMGATE
jgi:ABC-type nitrate/sulfonate/bicarbonate transport system permease component